MVLGLDKDTFQELTRLLKQIWNIFFMKIKDYELYNLNDFSQQEDLFKITLIREFEVVNR